jgi:hypothetical protein
MGGKKQKESHMMPLPTKAKRQRTYRKPIDEFTALPVSRQRKWQLRREKEGRCPVCGEPKATVAYCLKHAIAVRERTRNRIGCVRRTKSLTYKLAAKAKKKTN